jgi:hypothetical protein
MAKKFYLHEFDLFTLCYAHVLGMGWLSSGKRSMSYSWLSVVMEERSGADNSKWWIIQKSEIHQGLVLCSRCDLVKVG